VSRLSVSKAFSVAASRVLFTSFSAAAHAGTSTVALVCSLAGIADYSHILSSGSAPSGASTSH